MPKTENSTGRAKAWVASPFLHNDRLFRVGEELGLYASPQEIEAFVGLGHASFEPVATEKAVYALTTLSYNPAGAKFIFTPADRLDAVVPGDVLDRLVESGEAGYTKPEAVR